MAGKYATIMQDMPRMRATKSEYDDPSYQEKVEAEKQRILGTLPTPSPEEYARAWAALRAAKDAIEAQEHALNLSLEALAQMMSDAYEERGIESIRLVDGTTVRQQPEPQPVIEDKEAYRQWCVAQGLTGSMHLAYQTTASLLKERLVAGMDAPPGVRANVRTKFVLTKGKK